MHAPLIFKASVSYRLPKPGTKTRFKHREIFELLDVPRDHDEAMGAIVTREWLEATLWDRVFREEPLFGDAVDLTYQIELLTPEEVSRIDAG